VLADHAPDIVMFDVPPPDQGVRGIGAYRATWPPFFEWQASGAVFEIESLVVMAGTDLAFAYALLRCGTATDLARNPEHRLRLTLGLRKTGGRWVVAPGGPGRTPGSPPARPSRRWPGCRPSRSAAARRWPASRSPGCWPMTGSPRS
jgi:ketosteroid isomerase-like protein